MWANAIETGGRSMSIHGGVLALHSLDGSLFRTVGCRGAEWVTGSRWRGGEALQLRVGTSPPG